MNIHRVTRILIGLSLIGYGVYSGNAWFYLGVIPLITGIINWCPLEMKMGTCDPESGCCATPATNENTNNNCCATPTSQNTLKPNQIKDFSFSPKKGKIEVLGTGCKKCKELEIVAKEAVKKLGSDYEVVKVEDITEIAKYGVTATPALVVDGVVKSIGKVLSIDEVCQYIKNGEKNA